MRGEKSDVPMPLKRIQGRALTQDFGRLNQDVLFKNGKIDVCEDCYFILNHVYSMTNSDLNAKILQNQYKKNVRLF
jgi:hypothetical protein